MRRTTFRLALLNMLTVGVLSADDDAKLTEAADALAREGYSTPEDAREWVYERLLAGDTAESIISNIEQTIGVNTG